MDSESEGINRTLSIFEYLLIQIPFSIIVNPPSLVIVPPHMDESLHNIAAFVVTLGFEKDVLPANTFRNSFVYD